MARKKKGKRGKVKTQVESNGKEEIKGHVIKGNFGNSDTETHTQNATIVIENSVEATEGANNNSIIENLQIEKEKLVIAIQNENENSIALIQDEEIEEIERAIIPLSKKAKKRKRKQLEKENLEQSFQADATNWLPTEFVSVCKFNGNFPKELYKYWHKREKLFTKYNEGIWMDKEGWYSVTPEKVAKHIAVRMACDTIIDGFCGVGGNTIQFALTCNHVIAIEMDPIRLACARHNAEIYGVAHKIDFILGDYFEVVKSLKADCIFLSPPWGGPSYNKEKLFDLRTMMPFDGFHLFEVSKKVAPNIAYFLPRNSDYNQLGELAGDGICEIEEEYATRSFIAVTAYYGPKFSS